MSPAIGRGRSSVGRFPTSANGGWSKAEQTPSITDELLKLAELKEKGVLSEDEFTAAKAALLRKLHATAPPIALDPVT
jgi:hypothetical protein